MGVVSVAVGIGIPVFYETQIDNAVCKTHIVRSFGMWVIREMEEDADILYFFFLLLMFPLRYRRNARTRNLASLVADRALVSFALEIFIFIFNMTTTSLKWKIG